MTLTAELRAYLEKNHGLPTNASLNDAKALLGELVATGKIDTAVVAKLANISPSNDVKASVQLWIKEAVADALGGGGGGNTTQVKTLGGSTINMTTETNTDRIRVIPAEERWSNERKEAKHARTGEPITYQGSPVYMPSPRTRAKIGAFTKHFLRTNHGADLQKVGLPLPTITEHDEQLLKGMWANGLWCGTTAEGMEVEGKTFDDLKLKAPLINDATSGGQYLIPSDFDTELITTPLLYGELLPMVDLRPTVRDAVEAASIGNPTVTWSTAEGSALSAFDATSLIAQITETVRPVAVAIECGRDMLADSPADVGAAILEIFGQTMAKELDDVIATGNGTTQPEGIFTATSPTTVNSTNGSTGPWELDDIEALYFGIAKQYRIPSLNPCFLTNDVTYSRWRGLSIGTSDARRLLGDNYASYQTLGRPHLINGDVGNAQAAFVAMRRYRLWRRAGVEFFREAGGKTLVTANTILLMARARYAGCLVDGGGAAICEDGQS